MQPKVHLAKSTFAKHLSNFVEFKLGFGRLLVLGETVLDKLLNQVNLLRSRTQLLRGGLFNVANDVVHHLPILRL